jgi:hypothetical protein
MGGEDSLRRFYKAGLVHEDMVHPRGQGLDILGQFVVDALLRAWAETPPPGEAPALASAWDALKEKDAPPAPAAPLRVAVVAPDSHPVRQGLQAGLAAAGVLASPKQVEHLLVASTGPADEALTQALTQAREAHPKATCLWLALGAEAPPPEGCRTVDVKTQDPSWREALAEKGWLEGKDGGWTRRGGLGAAALVRAWLERERAAAPVAQPLMATEKVQ